MLEAQGGPLPPRACALHEAVVDAEAVSPQYEPTVTSPEPEFNPDRPR